MNKTDSPTYFKDWRRATGPKRRAYEKLYRKKHSKRLKKYAAQWHKAHPQFDRRQHLKQAYGMTPADFDAMLIKQKGKCGICKTTVPGGRGIFEVDHNHDTDEVRGLLCHQCNGGGGKFKDNPKLLFKAAKWFSK